MDNPTTLLVAIMYTTIVVTGLVNVLMTMSDIVGGKRKTHPLHTSWILLLLIVYLSFFWEAKAILDIEGWDFLSFVAFMVGPMALLFATNLLISPAEVEKGALLDRYYFRQSARFFFLLCLVQFWSVGLDMAFQTIDASTYLTGFVGFLFVALTLTKSYRLHVAGAAVVWLVAVARAILQAF